MPLQVTEASPERISEVLPEIEIDEVVKVAPLDDDVILSTGPVLSMLRVFVTEAVWPALSVAVPVTIWFAPSVLTVCAAGQVTGAAPPVHAKLTLTLVLFHPAELGVGDALAVTAKGVPPQLVPCTMSVLELEAPISVVTTTGPVQSPVITGILIELLVHDDGANPVPFNVTDPAWEPKFCPTTENVHPIPTFEGDRLKIVGRKLNTKLLLFNPCQLTTTGPAPAEPFGAVTTIFMSLQFVIVPATPLKLTVPAVFCPKPVPEIVTCVFGGPKLGLIPLTAGANCTFKVAEGEEPIAVVTTTGSAPVGALAGTLMLMEVLVHETIWTAWPLRVTEPVLEPKFWPVTDTACPAGTFCGLMLLIVGMKLKVTLLLLQFTTTGPEPEEPSGAFTTTLVALQETIVPATPLKLTVPLLVPNPEPVTITWAKGGPEVGLIEVIAGVAHIKAMGIRR